MNFEKTEGSGLREWFCLKCGAKNPIERASGWINSELKPPK
jgi:ribosomal protein L40E